MHLVKSVVYNTAVGLMRLYRDWFVDFRVEGRRNIRAGPKIFASNHISSTDPYWILPEFPEPVHVVVGPGYNTPWLANLLDFFEQIDALSDRRKEAVDLAVHYLRRGESVYIAPEGDIQPAKSDLGGQGSSPFELGRFYPGVARIHRRSGAPIIPAAIVAPPFALRENPRMNIEINGRVYRAIFNLRGPLVICFGQPFQPNLQGGEDPTEDERVADELRNQIQELVDDVRERMNW